MDLLFLADAKVQVLIITIIIWLLRCYLNDIMLDRLYYTSFCWSTFALLSRSNSTTPSCPFREARWRGVEPFCIRENNEAIVISVHMIPTPIYMNRG